MVRIKDIISFVSLMFQRFAFNCFNKFICKINFKKKYHRYFINTIFRNQTSFTILKLFRVNPTNKRQLRLCSIQRHNSPNFSLFANTTWTQKRQSRASIIFNPQYTFNYTFNPQLTNILNQFRSNASFLSLSKRERGKNLKKLSPCEWLKP